MLDKIGSGWQLAQSSTSSRTSTGFPVIDSYVELQDARGIYQHYVLLRLYVRELRAVADNAGIRYEMPTW